MRGQRLAGARAPRSSSDLEPTVLRIEPLEERVFLSATDWDAQYAAWLGQTFTVEDAANFQFNTDELKTLGDISAGAQADAAMSLIRSDVAAASYGYNGAGYTVAVIDTGIDYTHPALAGAYAGGWDFVDNDGDPRDQNGHGTHVAGIIASSASSAHPGIAPGVKIISLRVLGADGSGSFANVEKALQWVAQYQQHYNIVAVNMSLGAGNFSSNPWQFLEDDFATLESRGVFISTAAGNGFSTYGSQLGLGFPATSNYTVSVGAVWDSNYGAVNFSSGARDFSTGPDRLTSFSQRSSNLDIVAPGAFLTSAAMGGGWVRMAGTSMAAPVVAAASVLIHQALDAKGLGHLATQSFILDVMQDTGVTIVDGDDEQDNVTNSWLSFKRLDVASALNAVAQMNGSGGGGGTSNPGTSNPGTTNPGTTNPGTTTNPNSNYVRALYKEILGRDPDSAGLAYWTQLIVGGVSRTSVARSLMNSPEYRGRQVDTTFSDVLGRAASGAERSFWLNALSTGTDRTELVRSLLSSSEYQANTGTLGGFVDSAYQDVLGRAAEAAGKAYWVNFLSIGGTRSQFAQTLLTSSEYRLNTIGNYYQDYLGRTPGPSESNWWLGQVQSGAVTLGAIAQSFLGSDEYFASAQQSSGASSLASDVVVNQPQTPGSVPASPAAISSVDGLVTSAARSLKSQLSTVVTTADALDRWQATERARAAALGGMEDGVSLDLRDSDPSLIDATLECGDDADDDALLESIVAKSLAAHGAIDDAVAEL